MTRYPYLTWVVIGATAAAAQEPTCQPVTDGSFQSLPGVLISEIQDLVPERATILSRNPEFVSRSIDPNIMIDQEADISITFVDEGAGYRNAFGYVLYGLDDGSGQRPILCSESIWANASELGGGGDLVPGTTVELGTFPAGTNMGFFLIANGHRRGESLPEQARADRVFYTLDEYNTDGQRHVALIATQTRIDGLQPLILGFEDLPNLGDTDYNDAVFIINVSPGAALEEVLVNGNIPISPFGDDTDGDGVLNGEDPFPDDPARGHLTQLPGEDDNYFIAFEDLFPRIGDGDYNDLVVAFNVQKVTSPTGLVTDLRLVHKIIARGAGYDHAFRHRIRFHGYSATSLTQHFDRAGGVLQMTQGVHTDGADLTVFASTQAALFDETTFSALPNTEPGTDQKEGAFTVIDITFDTPLPTGALEAAPFDPYLFVHDTGYDIHLAGKAPIEGSNNPDSDLGRTFINDAGFPFAMLVPANWQYPEAGVYIGDAYPTFTDWHRSNGTRSNDWYGHPGDGVRDYQFVMPQ